MKRSGSRLGHGFEGDRALQAQITRLHRLMLYGRWLLVALLWLIVAPLSLWGLRSEMALWQSYFTWTALRYGLVFNPLPTAGLVLCVATTVSTLVWHSYTLLFGIPQKQRQRLTQQLMQIRRQGASHPLWRWVQPGS